MENSYRIKIFLFSKSKHWQTLGLGHLIQVESWIIFVRKAGVFPLEKVRQHKKFFIVNEIRRTASKIRCCIVLKDAIAKNFVANEHRSFTFVFTFSVVVVDLPTDCILSFLFPAEADVLVPVFSQSTDVVVVNFVVVLKFPNNGSPSLSLMYKRITSETNKSVCLTNQGASGWHIYSWFSLSRNQK